MRGRAYEVLRLRVLTERVATGASVNALAADFGVSKNVVVGIIDRAGKSGLLAEVEQRLRAEPNRAVTHPKPKPKPKPKALPPAPEPNQGEPAARFAFRMQQEGFTFAEIARRTGLDREAVQKRMKRLAARGIATLRQYDDAHPQVDANKQRAELRELVVRGWAAGKTLPSIAADLGISHSVAEKHRDRARQAGDPRAGYRRQPARKAQQEHKARKAPPEAPAASEPPKPSAAHQAAPAPSTEPSTAPSTAVSKTRQAARPPVPPPAAEQPPRQFFAAMVGPQHADRDERRAEAVRAQAHIDRLADAPLLSQEEEQRLIDEYIREKGVTVCETPPPDSRPRDFDVPVPPFRVRG